VHAGGCIEAAQVCQLKVGPPGSVDPNAAILFRNFGAVNSPDMAGAGGVACDGAVNLRDLVVYAGVHTGTSPYSRCADFTGDGAVNAADLVIYAIHHVRGAACN
jgi:hypothetical protein